MVVTSLILPPPESSRPPIEHRFAYPTVRPLPRPAVAPRAEHARAW